jgi:hypothetical protein
MMSPRQERRIRVHGVLREEPDLRKLARALIEFARQEAEAELAQGQAKDAASDGEPDSDA